MRYSHSHSQERPVKQLDVKKTKQTSTKSFVKVCCCIVFTVCIQASTTTTQKPHIVDQRPNVERRKKIFLLVVKKSKHRRLIFTSAPWSVEFPLCRDPGPGTKLSHCHMTHPQPTPPGVRVWVHMRERERAGGQFDVRIKVRLRLESVYGLRLVFVIVEVKSTKALMKRSVCVCVEHLSWSCRVIHPQRSLFCYRSHR